MGDARQERPGVPKRDANLTLAGSHCREKCLFWRSYASRTSILSGLLTSVERHRNRQHSTGGGKLCGCAAGENNRPIKPPVKRWHARARPHTTVREKCLSVGNLRGRMRPLFMLHGQSKGNGAVQNDREYVVVVPGDEDAFAPSGRYRSLPGYGHRVFESLHQLGTAGCGDSYWGVSFWRHCSVPFGGWGCTAGAGGLTGGPEGPRLGDVPLLPSGGCALIRHRNGRGVFGAMKYCSRKALQFACRGRISGRRVPCRPTWRSLRPAPGSVPWLARGLRPSFG